MVSIRNILVIATILAPVFAFPADIPDKCLPGRRCATECCAADQICVTDEKFPDGHCVDRGIIPTPRICLPNRQCGLDCCRADQKCVKDEKTGDEKCVDSGIVPPKKTPLPCIPEQVCADDCCQADEICIEKVKGAGLFLFKWS
ncbi:hypothetical protein TWF679_001441 [Orbilia oligospora]|uniref:Uncharacterized protein n=1 Tax=Orbilia oligospora TaxID=2813651 RepID=A0A8H8VH74_ORBOL|nr:hypothetical protein TWF679_001441 [Orbilia oligospora]